MNGRSSFHQGNIDLLKGDLARERLGMAGLPGVFSRGHLAWSLAELGRFGEAVVLWKDAERIAADVKHPFTIAFAEYCGGLLYLRRGDFDAARRQLEHGLSLCRSMNNRLELPFVTSFLGSAYAWSGRSDDGISLLREGIAQAAAIQFNASRSWFLGLLSEALGLAGQVEAARETAIEALDFARRCREPGWEAWANFMLGQAVAQYPQATEAGAREALMLAAEQAAQLSLRPLSARCELAIGRLYEREGDQLAATAKFGTARTMMEEMGMTGWLTSFERAQPSTA